MHHVGIKLWGYATWQADSEEYLHLCWCLWLVPDIHIDITEGECVCVYMGVWVTTILNNENVLF